MTLGFRTEKELLLSILYSNTLKVVMMWPSPGDKMELQTLEPRKIGCHEPLKYFSTYKLKHFQKNHFQLPESVCPFAPPFLDAGCQFKRVDFQGLMKLRFPRMFQGQSNLPSQQSHRSSRLEQWWAWLTWRVFYRWICLPLGCCCFFGGEGVPIESSNHHHFCGVRVLKSSGFDIDIRFGNCVAPREWIKVMHWKSNQSVSGCWISLGTSSIC